MELKCRKQNALIFVSCVILYLINRITKFHETNEGILKYLWDYNFTDFLCQIVYFSLCNLLLETFGKHGFYKLNSLLPLSLICAFYWEIGVLFTQKGTVFDPLDVGAYLLGVLVYYLLNQSWIP